MAAEAEVDWERNGDLAAQQPLDVFVVVMASHGRRGRGQIRRREEVAEEEREGEVVFAVQEGDFGEGFSETAVRGTNDETARCQFWGCRPRGGGIFRAGRTLWLPFLRWFVFEVGGLMFVMRILGETRMTAGLLTPREVGWFVIQEENGKSGRNIIQRVGI